MKKIETKNKYLKFMLFFFLLVSLISISSNYENLLAFESTNIRFNFESLIATINLIRFFLPFIILFPITYWSLKKNKEFILFNKIFIIYSVFSLAMNLIYIEKINDIENIQLGINLINLILIFHLVTIYNWGDLFKKFLTVELIIIFFIGFYYSNSIYYEFINPNNDNILLNFYTTETLNPSSGILGIPNPRVTGLGRMMFIILTSAFFLVYETRNIFLKTIILILSVTTFFFIYAMQSRGAFVGVIILLLYFIFIFKTNVIKKILIIILVFLMPIFFFQYNKFLLTTNKVKKSDFNNLYSSFLKENRLLKINDNNKVLLNVNNSGRTSIWINILKKIEEKKIIFGLGFQADRKILINDFDYKGVYYDNNASNIFLYSYLTSGLIGIILITSIYFLALKQIYYFIIKNNEKKNIYHHFSIVIITFLLLRGFFENSFSLFSIDFIFFVNTYYLLLKFNKKN
jgi:O-antigen ligase